MSMISSDGFFSNKTFGNIKKAFYDNILSYLFLLPFFAFLALLLWFPFIRGIYMTFFNWSLLGGETFVGLGNYRYIFSWNPFYTSLKVTLLYLLTTVIQLGIALVAALALANADLSGKLSSITNGIFLVPYTMPPVVTGALWILLLHPIYGPIFKPLVKSGILSEPIYWSLNSGTALAGLIFVGGWTFWPFMFLIIYASRESIPADYYESAKMYGSNKIQTFAHVTYPQIRSAILIAVSIRIIWNLAKISQPLQMTQGGPGYSTSMLAVLLYRFAWRESRLGRAYVIGIVLFVVSLAAVFIFIREANTSGSRF